MQNQKAGKGFAKLFDLLPLIKISFMRLEVPHLEEGFSQSLYFSKKCNKLQKWLSADAQIVSYKNTKFCYCKLEGNIAWKLLYVKSNLYLSIIYPPQLNSEPETLEHHRYPGGALINSKEKNNLGSSLVKVMPSLFLTLTLYDI